MTGRFSHLTRLGTKAALLAMLAGASLGAGCVATVHQHPSNSRGHGGQHSDCGPAHHMENGRCVHNGNGRHRGHD